MTKTTTEPIITEAHIYVLSCPPTLTNTIVGTIYMCEQNLLKKPVRKDYYDPHKLK